MGEFPMDECVQKFFKHHHQLYLMVDFALNWTGFEQVFCGDISSSTSLFCLRWFFVNRLAVSYIIHANHLLVDLLGECVYAKKRPECVRGFRMGVESIDFAWHLTNLQFTSFAKRCRCWGFWPIVHATEAHNYSLVNHEMIVVGKECTLVSSINRQLIVDHDWELSGDKEHSCWAFNSKFIHWEAKAFL